MNRKEAILVTVVAFATFITGAFAEISPTAPSRTTLQTTSTDIQVVRFEGVGVPQGGNAYTTPTDGIAVGILTAAFSFAPVAGFQQISSVTATIIYQAAYFYGRCNPCHQDDRFSIQLNGQFVINVEIAGTVLPLTAVTTVSNLRVGSNMISIFTSNPDPQVVPNAYYIYQVRLTVEYTFLA